MEFIRFFLILLVPGIIGSIAYSIANSLRTKVDVYIALILDLLTFTTMITFLYFWKHVYTMNDLMNEFNCLSFTRNYICLSTTINIAYGVLFGIIRRFFFWIRH